MTRSLATAQASLTTDDAFGGDCPNSISLTWTTVTSVLKISLTIFIFCSLLLWSWLNSYSGAPLGSSSNVLDAVFPQYTAGNTKICYSRNEKLSDWGGALPKVTIRLEVTVLYFWVLSWISRCPGFVLDLKSSE